MLPLLSSLYHEEELFIFSILLSTYLNTFPMNISNKLYFYFTVYQSHFPYFCHLKFVLEVRNRVSYRFSSEVL